MRRVAVMVLALAGVGAAAQVRAQADRVVGALDVNQRQTVKGHVAGWTSTEGDLGAVSADVQLEHLTVVLTRSAERQAAFEQLLADQQNPQSPRYHQWLTPEQIGEQYGPTQNDVDAVTGWLTAQGLRVDGMSPARTMVTFSGASGRVARALGAEFHRYHVMAGTEEQERIAVSAEPSVPTALAGVIAGFRGLSEQRLVAHSHMQALPESAAGGVRPQYTSSSTVHYLSPADFVKIFDVQSAYTVGLTGTGVKVAIIGRSRVKATDITSFQTLFGLNTTAQPVVIIPTTGTDPGYSSTDQGEQTLDVNRVMSTATGAEADLVVSASSVTDDGVDIAVQYEVNTVKDPVMNISYGDCERNEGSSGVSYWNTLFGQAAAEGITTLVSSGDSAVSGCASAFAAPSGTLTPSINAICANPYVTCVGGTEFADAASPSTYWNSANSATDESALGYIPEGGWNEPGTGPTYVVAGSGGGVSLYMTKPTWQAGTGVPADGFRDVPDVALPSSLHDGYMAYLNGSKVVFGGTSAAAPGMAGIVAMAVQQMGGAQGNINPEIYALGASGAMSVFHDVTPATSGVSGCTVSTASMCNNSAPSTSSLTGGTAGFAVTTGYDQVTGWGSVDVYNLLTAVAASFVVGQGTTLTVTAGNSGTSSVTVTSQNRFAGVVAMTCAITTMPANETATPTCTVQQAAVTLTSGSTATVTVNISTTKRNTQTSVGAAGLWWMGAGLGAMLVMGARRRRVLPALAAVAMVFVLGGAVGCGSGGSAPVLTPSGTTAGSYVCTVTGTSLLQTASGNVNFTVN